MPLPDPSVSVAENIRQVRQVLRYIEGLLGDGDLDKVNMRRPPGVVAGVVSVVDALEKIARVVGVQELERHRLLALANVGQVINSSLDPTMVLNEVMDTIILLMRAERGFLMLRNSEGEMTFRIARNMDRKTLDASSFGISRTIVRRVATSGEPVLTTNAQEDPRFDKEASVSAYQLRSILCVPLLVKGVVTGVIYTDNRLMTNLFGEQDRDIMMAFANQAAVAIDNARLFDDLQRSNSELAQAYEATLEGWVRALDLRDKETEGHTRRVTRLTVQLARKLGIPEVDLVNIQRGALLHDIGKMGIPDRILNKPGALDDDEWEEMRRHPGYAYEMLSAIDFLKPAIDIPHCHHEKWDGSGYPRGLKEEDIPLAARIFAIVDVWDALTSDRPYHKAWEKEKVYQHLREQSETHFDPIVVDAFLALVEEG